MGLCQCGYIYISHILISSWLHLGRIFDFFGVWRRLGAILAALGGFWRHLGASWSLGREIHEGMHVGIYMYVYIEMYVYVCMYIYMYVCVYI